MGRRTLTDTAQSLYDESFTACSSQTPHYNSHEGRNDIAACTILPMLLLVHGTSSSCKAVLHPKPLLGWWPLLGDHATVITPGVHCLLQRTHCLRWLSELGEPLAAAAAVSRRFGQEDMQVTQLSLL